MADAVFEVLDGSQRPPPAPIAIVADDLTGCCDAAASFAGRGTAVCVFCSRPADPGSDAGVVACCTASRADAAAEAALKVKAVCRCLVPRGPLRLFKKIDSTLQGNIGVEVETMLHNSPANIAVICPAFPAQGRVLEQGFLRVAGNLAADVHLPRILSSQSSLPQSHFTIQAAAQMLGHKSWELGPRRPALWVFDAATSHDLSHVAMIIVRLGSAALAVGSSGLARELAPRWLPVPASARHDEMGIVQTRHVFAVIGTRNKTTARQVEHFQEHYSGFFADSDTDSEVVGRSDSRPGIVFRHAWNPQSDRLLRTFLDQLPAREPGTLLLSGGDTAQLCCQLTNTERIAIYRELDAGVAFGRLLDGKLKGWQIVTKAGGFGSPDLLSRVWARLMPSDSLSRSSHPSQELQGP